jgi:hypothetical protein
MFLISLIPSPWTDREGVLKLYTSLTSRLHQSYYSTDFKPSFNVINQLNIYNNNIFIILNYSIYNHNINIILKP